MAKITVDLSGQLGLAPTFAGDLNSTTSSPQLRYIGAPGQLADGVFDPLRVQGYMSPANNTYTAITGTLTNEIVSAEYCASSDTVYLAQNGLVLSTISTLSGTSVSNTTVLTGQSAFRDLEVYQINGQQSLFYAYSYADSSVTNQTNLAVGFLSVDSTKGAFQIAAEVYESGATPQTEGIANGTASGRNETVNRNKLSQKFLTADFSVSANPQVSGVRLRLKMPYIGTSQTWTLKVGIQTNNGGSPSGTYVANASTTLAASSLPTGEFEYVYFAFPAVVSLTASTTYHLVIEPTVDAVTLADNQGVYWYMSDSSNSQYTTGAAEWNTQTIIVSVAAATDVVTITTPTTLAAAGIIQGTNLYYGFTSAEGLVQGTTYYVGSISGQTFKLYTDVHLLNVVNITGDASGIPFDMVPAYPNILFDNISKGTASAATSLTFNSAATGTLTDGMAIVTCMCDGAFFPTITWGGVSMTSVYSAPIDGWSIFMLANPPSGVASVVVTWAHAPTDLQAYAMTYANVSSTLAYDAVLQTSLAGSVGDVTKSLTTVANKAFAAMLIYAYTTKVFYSASTGVTIREKDLTGLYDISIGDSGTPISPAGAYSMTMTRDGGGTGTVGSLLFSFAPATTAKINTGWWNSQTSSYDFALILNQYTALIGPTITNGLSSLNAYQEQNDASVFLHSAQNGFLYLFTNNRVSKFDGGDTGNTYVDGINSNSGIQGFGTFTADVLTFPTYINTIDVVDTNSLAYIAIEDSKLATPEYRTFPANTIGVYAWDYQSILSTIRNYYPAPGARNIKRIFLNSTGDIRLITIGEDGFAELRGLSAGKFQVLYKMGLNSYPSKRDSIGYMNNMVTWLGADGYTYLLGSIRPDTKEALYKIGDTTGLQVGTFTPGVMLVGNSTTTQSRDGIFISYKDTSSGNKLVHWYPHGVGTVNSVAQKGNAGNVYPIVIEFPTLVKVNYIRVYHAPVGTTSATVQGTLKTFVNQSTTLSRTDSITGADIVKGYKYIKFGQALQSGVFALQLEIVWPTTTTLSTTTDWMTRMIEIDYEDITKLY